jgi:hypothetical protein
VGVVEKCIWPAWAAFGALQNIMATKHSNLKFKGESMKRFAWAQYVTAAKFGAYGKIGSTAFVTSTTDAFEPCAALP